LTRIVPQRTFGHFASPAVLAEACPVLGIFYNENLKGVGERQTKFLKGLVEHGKLHLRNLSESKSDPERAGGSGYQIRGSLLEPLDVVEFACHGRHDDSNRWHSYLQLSNEYKLTLLDLDAMELSLDSHPLVLLNTCMSGMPDPVSAIGFANVFLQCGACGVIATESEVLDEFAGQFAVELYDRLLSGQPVGQSLREARRYFLTTQNDLTGLAYSLYASPETRLI
jgi:hypothetical protein